MSYQRTRFSVVRARGLFIGVFIWLLLAAIPSTVQAAFNSDELAAVPVAFDWHACDTCLYTVRSFDGIVLVIPGGEEHDVHDVVTTLVLLNGCFPLHYQFTDVVAIDDVDPWGCKYAEVTPDGYVDLILEFDRQRVMDAGFAFSEESESETRLNGITWDGREFELDCCIPTTPPGSPAETVGQRPAASLILVDSSTAQPNPFKHTTAISYTLAQRAYVSIEVFDLLGRKVRILTAFTHAAGDYSVSWDGTDDAGRPLQNGTYLYRVTANSETSAGKLVLLK